MFNLNLKRSAAALLAVAVMWPAIAGAGSLSAPPDRVPGEVLVVPRSTVSAQAVGSSIRAMGMEVAAEHRGATRFLRLKLGAGQSVDQTVQSLAAQPWVAHAQPNYIYRATALPNDPEFAKYWGLRNTGQTVNGTAGTAGADISAPAAWDDTTDCSAITVAVIDSGVAYDHPDLAANIWSNAGETAGNGVDDDGNGFIDDVRGWDFVQGDNDPMDFHYHGTHVAGTIGAAGNNATGGTGVCWNVKLMPLRGLGTTGSGSTADIAAAIDYAVANGANVINMSLGGTGGSAGDIQDTAIANAHANGVLVVAAAGNDGTDNDTTPHYPASYTQPNIIAVAATDQNDALASFSNFGATSVDIAAPGVNIHSDLPPARQTAASWNFDTGAMQGWTGSTIDTTTGNPVANTVGVTAATSRSPSYSLTDTPGGNYANNRRYLATSPAVDLSGEEGAKLESALKISTEIYTDIVYTELSTDGVAWTNLGGLSGSTLGTWYTSEADLQALDGSASAQVRFRLETNASTVDDGVYGDDLAITVAGPRYSSAAPPAARYGYLNGTSMATPHVAGLAALVWAARTGLTHLQVRDKILNNGDALAALSGKTVTGMRINAQMSMPVRAVTGLTATAVSATRVDLGWTDNSINETGYRVERKTGAGTYTTLTTLAANASAYSDTAAPAGSSLTYRVTGTASDGLGLEPSVTVSTTTPPAAPTGVSASAGDGQVSVSWSAATGATSYNLYWSTTAGVTPATGTKIANVTSPYTHTGLTNGTTYYYVVTAVNAAGEGSASTQASATPAASGGGGSSSGGGGGGCTLNPQAQFDPTLLLLLLASGILLARRRA